MNIISYSGGKDSTAMLLLMKEKNIKIDRITFADTTLEYPEMYGWIKKIEKIIQIKIEKIKPEKNYNDWFYGIPKRGKFTNRIRGFPYVINPCWWNREAKYKLLEKSHGKNNNIYIGITTNEKHRTKRKQYQKYNNQYKFPLVEWGINSQDCFEYLKSKNLKHPLSKFKRTGCWLCQKQSIGSLKILYFDYQELWKKLKKYESDSPHGFSHHFKLVDLEDKFMK